MCLEKKKKRKNSTKTKLREDGRMERHLGKNTQVASTGYTKVSCWPLPSFPFHSWKMSELQLSLSSSFMISQEKVSWVAVNRHYGSRIKMKIETKLWNITDIFKLLVPSYMISSLQLSRLSSTRLLSFPTQYAVKGEKSLILNNKNNIRYPAKSLIPSL